MVRPHPQSLVSRAELLSRSHELQVVAELLDLQPSQITKFKKRGWKEGCTGRSKRPVPDDFAFMAGRMTKTELCRHYRAGFPTVLRWFREKPTFHRPQRGWALRIDPDTGKRNWQLKKERDK